MAFAEQHLAGLQHVIWVTKSLICVAYRKEAHRDKGLKVLLLLLSFAMIWSMVLAHLIPFVRLAKATIPRACFWLNGHVERTFASILH